MGTHLKLNKEKQFVKELFYLLEPLEMKTLIFKFEMVDLGVLRGETT